MIEAKKLAYADMLRYVADPRFADVPVAAMLSKDYARERAARIDPRAIAQARSPRLAVVCRCTRETRCICPSSIATATWCR